MGPKKQELKKPPHQKLVNYTLCVPTTVVSRANAPNLQQATGVLYQIAKVASIYNVSEIVIMDTFQELPEPVVDLSKDKKKIKFDDDALTTTTKQDKPAISEEAMFIATVLQYFVTPPYLVKTVFKQHLLKHCQYAKQYPKLTTLPFMSTSVESEYREGLTVTMGKITKPQNKKKKASTPLKITKYVNIGHDKYLELKGQQVPTNVRVTVDVEQGKVVSPLEAYKDQVGAKASYGYHVRISRSFSAIFTESAYPEGYSRSVYVNSGDYFHHSSSELKECSRAAERENLLLVVGRWSDVEFAFEQDKKNLEGVSDAKEFFDGQVTIPPGTRVEDGCLIALTKLSV